MSEENKGWSQIPPPFVPGTTCSAIVWVRAERKSQLSVIPIVAFFFSRRVCGVLMLSYYGTCITVMLRNGLIDLSRLSRHLLPCFLSKWQCHLYIWWSMKHSQQQQQHFKYPSNPAVIQRCLNILLMDYLFMVEWLLLQPRWKYWRSRPDQWKCKFRS